MLAAVSSRPNLRPQDSTHDLARDMIIGCNHLHRGSMSIDTLVCLTTDIACFATGDLGWIDLAAGVLHVVGRSGMQVKISGAYQRLL